MSNIYRYIDMRASRNNYGKIPSLVTKIFSQKEFQIKCDKIHFFQKDTISRLKWRILILKSIVKLLFCSDSHMFRISHTTHVLTRTIVEFSHWHLSVVNFLFSTGTLNVSFELKTAQLRNFHGFMRDVNSSE